jgi:hypothetical protein
VLRTVAAGTHLHKSAIPELRLRWNLPQQHREVINQEMADRCMVAISASRPRMPSKSPTAIPCPTRVGTHASIFPRTLSAGAPHAVLASTPGSVKPIFFTMSKSIVLRGMGECDYRQEQEFFLYKLLGQISSRKCGGVSAEIGSSIFRGVGKQTAHACSNACSQQLGGVKLQIRQCHFGGNHDKVFHSSVFSCPVHYSHEWSNRHRSSQ